jgi:hypothetical protein
VYLFLFSDMVVVAKEPEAKSSGITLRRGGSALGSDKMQMIDCATLTELSRVTNIKSFGVETTFQFKLDGVTYSCASDEERQIWINHIHRLLRDLRSRAPNKVLLFVLRCFCFCLIR